MAVLFAFAGKLAAADIKLKTSDAFGTSSITGSTNWSNGLVASGGNSYYTTNFTLRTPAPTVSGNTYIFGGDSLSIDPVGRLIGKIGNGVAGSAVSATLTFSNLILNGGLLDQADVNNNNSTFFLEGNVFVNANSSLGAIGAITSNSSFFNTLDILAPISGAANLQVSGSSVVNGADTGVVKLSAANPYSGTMTVSSGTNAANGSVIASQINRMLQLNNVDALSNATLNLIAGPAAQNLVSFASGANTAPFKLGALAGVSAQALTDTAGSSVALIVGSKNVNSTYSGILSGGGSLTKVGSGTLTLLGAHSFSGNTTVNGGVLALGAASTLTNSPIISIASGATLDVSSNAFVVLGSQSLFSGGTNRGNISIGSGGKIYAGGDGSYGTNVITSNLVFSNGATAHLDLGTLYNGANDLVTVAGNLDLNNTAFHLKAASAGVNLDTTTDYTLIAVSGTITGSASSTPIWDTAPLNAANYSIIQSGNSIKLHYLPSAPPAGTLSFTPSSVVHNQATLVSVTVTSSSHPISSVSLNASPIGGSPTLALIAAGGNVYTNTIVISPSLAPGDYAFVATIVDNTSLSGTTPPAVLSVLSANAVWNGGGANNNWSANANWTGGTAPGTVGDSVVFAGTTRLTPSMDAAFNVATLSFDSSAGSFIIGSAGNILTLSGSGVVNNSSISQTLNLPIVNAGQQTFTAQSGDLTFNQSITNSSSPLNVNGSANTTFNGRVAGIGGLVKNDGSTLFLNGTNTFTGSIIITNGTVEVAGAGLLGSGSYAGNIANFGSFVYSSSASQNISGIISGQGVTKSGSGTLTLSGTNTYTGPTTINSGVLRIAGSGTLNSGMYAGTIVNNGTLQYSSSAKQTLSGASALSGTGGLIVDGPGTLVNNAGAYSGPTVVRGGVLALNTSLLGASSFGDLTISNGAVAITSFGDASINVANLSFQNNAQLNLNYDFSFGNPTVGAVNATALTVPGTNITINVGGVAPAIGQFPLVSYAGSVLPSIANFTLGGRPLGATATLVNNTANQTIDLNVTAVNPTTWIPLVANDALGNSSFNSGLSWQGGAVPASGNGYHTKTFQLRSPADGNAYTFGGSVLSVDTAPSRFILKGTGGQTITVSNLILNGGIFDYANAADSFTATFNGGITLQGGTLSYMGALGTGNPAICETFIINASIGGSGNLQVGPEFAVGADTGNLVFAGTNNYTGQTAVSTGTLIVNGQNGNSVLTVRSGAALAGLGSLNGPVTVQAGGNLIPGVPAFGALTPVVGVLTVNNTVTLAGATTLRLDRNATPKSDRLTALSVAVNSGATLTVTNTGSTNLVAGDTFTLFSIPVTGAFTAVTLPALPSPTLIWTNKIAVDGTIAVLSTQSVNPNPTNVTVAVSGGNLVLSWPSDHTGWTLQAQTNSLSVGLGVNWFDVPGSTGTNQISIPFNSANGAVFYRLKL